MRLLIIRLSFFILCLPLLNSFANYPYRNHYPDFELSLSSHEYNQKWRDLYRSRENLKFPTFCVQLKNKIESLYEADRARLPNHSKKEKIPKIIHQIWLGSSIPVQYEKWMNTWKNWEGWDYHLWTDKDLETLDLQNSKEFRQSQNFGEKSDLLRYEILYQFGGLYVDIDFECLDPDFFNFAVKEYAYFSGIDPLDISEFRCENALLASTPGHPFIKKLMDEIPINQYKRGTLNKTGPHYLTRQVDKYWDLLEDGIIFPPSFFYPISNHDLIGQEILSSFFFPETAAVHYFEGSWAR
jgi:inositol phosphorylceramide mannosyltransferase catalytic subunit